MSYICAHAPTHDSYRPLCYLDDPPCHSYEVFCLSDALLNDVYRAIRHPDDFGSGSYNPLTRSDGLSGQWYRSLCNADALIRHLNGVVGSSRSTRAAPENSLLHLPRINKTIHLVLFDG